MGERRMKKLIIGIFVLLQVTIAFAICPTTVELDAAFTGSYTGCSRVYRFLSDPFDTYDYCCLNGGCNLPANCFEVYSTCMSKIKASPPSGCGGGTPPGGSFSFTPNTGSYGTVVVNQQSSPIVITAHNNYSTARRCPVSLSNPDDFIILNDTCTRASAGIPAGGTCTVTLFAVPSSNGSKTTQVSCGNLVAI
jgi:hypothetical protein